MSNYTLLIAWSVAGCSLAGVLLMYWRYRRMVRYYNKYIMKYIREHDLLAKELEHALIKKVRWRSCSKLIFRKLRNETILTPRPAKERRTTQRDGINEPDYKL